MTIAALSHESLADVSDSSVNFAKPSLLKVSILIDVDVLVIMESSDIDLDDLGSRTEIGGKCLPNSGVILELTRHLDGTSLHICDDDPSSLRRGLWRRRDEVHRLRKPSVQTRNSDDVESRCLHSSLSIGRNRWW